jgi:glycosyltransferase involved in cell wall biosynthesis
VHTYHGHIFHSYYGPFKTRVFITIEKILARMTDRVVVISQRQLQEIHLEFGIGRKEQFAVIPLGLDTSVFAHWKQRRQAARKELGLGERDLAVGIVGRLTEIKNHALFLRAAALHKQSSGGTKDNDRQTARFVIIGDGHLRRRLEEQAISLGLQGEVVFTGLRDDPESFYAALDVVALTSLNEGTPLTIIEAMANARPVVSTAVGGVVDLLGDCVLPVAQGNETKATKPGFIVCERGIRVESNDADNFCRGLNFLLERESLRQEMGERGRVFVEQNYSKERLVADVLALYEDLVRPNSANAF